jgi:SAM-dependent methyltransferase
VSRWRNFRKEPRKPDDLRIDYARDYLEKNALPEYFDAINPDTPESLREAQDKLSPLLRHMPAPTNIVSVGVGSGEEMHAAISMYPGRLVVVHGLDISPSAVEFTRNRLAKYGLRGVVTEGSAIDMPYPPGSIDAFVFSSIMHEIYSYVPDGRQAWMKAMVEVAQKTSPGGILLLRDFAAPDYGGSVRLSFRSQVAAEFYDYFSHHFRAFSGSTDQMRESIVDRRSGPDGYLPRLAQWGVPVELPASAAAEVLLHFKNFSDHVNRGITHLGDLAWKELNEAYLPPDPFTPGFYPMPQADYVMQVEAVMAQALQGTPYTMVCVENGRSVRPGQAAFLGRHFQLERPRSRISSEEIISGFTCKMELVFRKVSS